MICIVGRSNVTYHPYVLLLSLKINVALKIIKGDM